MLEYPEGVGRVTVAERIIDIEALAGATEGVAETPPELAKVAGRNIPAISKNNTPVRDEATMPLCLDLKIKANDSWP